MVQPTDDDLADGHELFWVSTKKGPWVLRWLKERGGWQTHGSERLILAADAAASGWMLIGRATFSLCPNCLKNGWLTTAMGAERTPCPTCLDSRVVTGGELSSPFRRLLRGALNDQVIVLELEANDPDTGEQRRRVIETDINRLNILRGLYS
jgi:hypothetical protein